MILTDAPSAEDWAYAAGLVDGEGSVLLTRIHKRSKRAPVVSISSTPPELLQWMRSTFGGNLVVRTKTKSHHKTPYVWSLSHDKALWFLRGAIKYLRESSKVKRANMLIHHYKSVTPRNGKYTTEQHTARTLFEEDFFRIGT